MGRRNIGTRMVGHLAGLLVGILPLVAVGAGTVDRSQSVPILGETVLPAQGRQQTLMQVPAFGRYSVVAESEQGAALQLVDRMSGPGPVEGIPGEQDGRLDMFLERGEYKLITLAHERGKGEVKLTTHTFTELNTEPTRLVELKEIHTHLKDFELRSYWIEIKQRRHVAIEAAGRSLGDLRLWKDGDWLVKAEPSFVQLNPKPGQPLAAYRLTADLEPGLYRLTAYGGSPQPWAEQSDESPLYIRYGTPRLDVAGRRYCEVSPFGIDRWLVPYQANYFRLELPEALPASLAVGGYVEQRPFEDPDASAQIGKQSIPPVAELDWNGSNGLTLVTVTAGAGQPYVLQQFESRQSYSFSKDGEYWISTLHAGSGGDSVDATSLLTRRSPGRGLELVAARPLLLEGNRRWRRRFNLLDVLTLHLEVPRTGSYRIAGEGEGVKARFRVEPFMTARPKDYRSPPFEVSGHLWHLDAGYYELTVKPELKGIVDLVISPEVGAGELVDGDSSVAASTRYVPVSLNGRDQYTLYLNRQPGVRSGVVLRELPIDLDLSLPLSLRKGERIDVPVRVSEPGIIVARTVQGELTPISVDRSQSAQRQRVEAGRHRVILVNGGEETLDYTLAFIPARLDEAAPLPAIPRQRLRDIPDFPLLSGEATRFFDLPRTGVATYNLAVERAALYRLESSGLLDTSGDLRTRTNPSLQSRQGGGVGRNFLIQSYLREGNYQITVKTNGASAGHLGLSLKHAELMDGGRLALGVPARFTLPEGRGLAYGFEIAEAGEYRLRVLSVGQVRSIRLEDEAGWPLLQPDLPGDLRYRFSPGRYRIIIPPNPVAGRVVSRLEAVPPPPEFSGHGPHPLALGSRVGHLWMEPAQGQPRLPDQWLFELSAEADGQIELDSEMQGELFLLGEDGSSATKIGQVGAIKPWRGRLRAGRYRLEVRSGRPNNQVSYQVSVRVEQLIAGAQREVGLPAELELSVGREALVELGSFGMTDLRARLFDAEGKLLAQNDDRDNDWNFLIARKLDAGRYRLKLDPVGKAGGNSSVFMRIPAGIEEPALALPASMTLDDDGLHTFPLSPPAGRSLLLVTADSADTVGITLEVNKGEGWQWSATSAARAAHLLVPLSGNPEYRYRLRLWSIDRRGAVIALKADAVALSPEREGRAEIPLRILEQGEQRFALAELTLSRPGVVSLAGGEGLIGSGIPGLGLQPLPGDKLAVSGTRLWLALPLSPGEEAPPLRMRRVELAAGPGAGVQFTVPGGQTIAVDLAASDGGPRLVVADSRSGLPGLQVVDAAEGSKRSAGLAVAAGSSAGVSLGDARRVWVWNAEDGDKSLEVSLRQTSFAPPRSERAGYGVTPLALEAASARRFELPPGSKRLQLALPPGSAAVCSEGERVISTHWAGDAPLSERVDTQASRLTLLYRGGKAAQAQLEITPLDEASAARLGGVALLQQRFPSAGVARVRVTKPAGPQRLLHLRGDVEATLVQDDGRVARGLDLTLTDSADLILRHRPGLLLAWLEGPDDEEASNRAVEPTPLPATLDLEGDARRISFDLPAAALLHLRSDAALIMRLRYQNGAQRVEAYPQGMAADLFLPPGVSRLDLRGIGGGELAGRLWLSTDPAVSIGEGEGPVTLLNAGATALYRFDIEKSGPVGIGVRASSDLIEARLMDEGGQPLSQGVVQMPSLRPGSYYLAIRAPAPGAPIQVRPLLVGKKAPDSGPPREVIRDYLEKAGMKMDAQESP